MRFARDGRYAANLTKPPAVLTRISARNGGSFPEVKMRRYVEGAGQVAAHAPATCPSGGSLAGLDRDRAQIRNVLTEYVKSLQTK